MRRIRTTLVLIVLLALAAAACAGDAKAPAAPPKTSADVVKVTGPAPLTAKAGAQVTFEVKVEIAKHWHLYSHSYAEDPESMFIGIDLAAGEGCPLTDVKVVYPEAVKGNFLGDEVMMHEGALVAEGHGHRAGRRQGRAGGAAEPHRPGLRRQGLPAPGRPAGDGEGHGPVVKAAAGLRQLFLLRDDVVFLNHGSFGACPRPVLDTYQKLQRELESEPVDFLHEERDLPARMRAARAELARFLGARRDDLVFVPNATTGLNVVAHSLPLHRDDEVLVHRPRVRRHGPHVDLRVRAARRAATCARTCRCRWSRPQQVVEAVWSGVTERTRVLFLSHLTSTTALIFPVGRAGAPRARAPAS